MNAEQIQKTLFQRYYSDDQLSEGTSSHWRKFGRKSTVKQTVDGFDFNAYGISAFARKNIPVISTFKHYPIDYPWGDEEIFIDELCPFYQYYPSSRPPFWRPFDGPIRHRLVKL